MVSVEHFMIIYLMIIILVLYLIGTVFATFFLTRIKSDDSVATITKYAKYSYILGYVNFILIPLMIIISFLLNIVLLSIFMIMYLFISITISTFLLLLCYHELKELSNWEKENKQHEYFFITSLSIYLLSLFLIVIYFLYGFLHGNVLLSNS